MNCGYNWDISSGLDRGFRMKQFSIKTPQNNKISFCILSLRFLGFIPPPRVLLSFFLLLPLFFPSIFPFFRSTILYLSPFPLPIPSLPFLSLYPYRNISQFFSNSLSLSPSSSSCFFIYLFLRFRK